MKKIYLLLLMVVGICGSAFSSHELPLLNPTFTNNGTTVTFVGSSDPATCGGTYYLEAELTCFGLGTPNWSVSFFLQGPQWSKPNCQLQAHPALVFNLNDPMFCPGSTYAIRYRERIIGATPNPPPASNWSQVYNFTVPGTPPPLVINSVTTSDDTICPSGQAQLDVTASGGCGDYSYSWFPTTGLTPASGNVANPFASPTVSTTYTVVVSDLCTGFSMVDSIRLEVAQPIPSGIILANQVDSSIVVCQGDTVNLVLTGSGGTSFQWSSSSNGTTFNTVSGATGTSYLFGPVNNSTQFYVDVQAPGFCPGRSPKFTVTVIPNVIPSASPDQNICLGDSISLFAGGGGTYSWGPPYNIVDETTNNPGVFPTVTTTYQVEVTNQWGCKGYDSVTVAVNPQPVFAASSFPAICPMNNGTIVVDTVTVGSPAFTYALSSGTAPVGDSFFNLAPGSYAVTVTDANGCQSSQSISVGEVVDIVADFTADPLTGPVPLGVNFINTSTGTIASYHWNFGEGSSSTVTNPTHSFTEHGTYLVILTAYGSDARCMDTAMIVIDAIGQSSVFEPNVFSPNGDGNNDFFTLSPVNITNMELLIFDRWGKKVAEVTDMIGWDGKRRGGGEASPGTYFFTYSAKGIDQITHSGSGYLQLVR